MISLIKTAKMQTIGQWHEYHRPIGRFSSTRGIANKGPSGLRRFVFRMNFTNGGYERSPHPLTCHTTGTLWFIQTKHGNQY
jgi:hypothetical protein